MILYLYHLYHLYITYSCDTIVISQLLEVTTAPPCTVLSSQLGSGTGWLFVGSIDRKMIQNRPRIEGTLPGNRGQIQVGASGASGAIIPLWINQSVGKGHLSTKHCHGKSPMAGLMIFTWKSLSLSGDVLIEISIEFKKFHRKRPATWNWPRSDGAYPLPLNMTNLFYPSLRCLANQSD